MSTASSIDLLVDLKEIQSQSPPVAFFLLWEIKWLHCPCLSALTVIISPSSLVARSWFPLAVSLLRVYSDAKYLFRLFHKPAFVVPFQMWAEWRTAAMQIIITEEDRAGGQSLGMEKGNQSLATALLQCLQRTTTTKNLISGFQLSTVWKKKKKKRMRCSSKLLFSNEGTFYILFVNSRPRLKVWRSGKRATLLLSE